MAHRLIIALLAIQVSVFAQLSMDNIDSDTMNLLKNQMINEVLSEESPSELNTIENTSSSEVSPKLNESTQPSLIKAKLSSLEEDYNQLDIKQDLMIHLKPLMNYDATTNNVINVDESNLFLNDPLEQFGYDVFIIKSKIRSDISNTIPTDYKLNNNDTVTLFIYGKKEQVMELMIDNSGDVFIPGIGPISIINLTLNEATQKIKQYLSQKYTNFKCKLKLNSLEPVSIIISGDVEKPGVYKVNKFQNIIQILANTGGIKKTGSLRQIKRLRYGKKPKVIDLYGFLINEKLQSIEAFQEGDIIHVPKIGNTMAISGQVKSPGIYEIRRGESVYDAIRFASGYRLNAYKNAIYLNRFDNLFKRQVNVIFKDSAKSLNVALKKEKLKNGDVIFIKSKPKDIYGYLHIMGNIEIPGKYKFKSGITLSQLILQAKGLKPNTYDAIHIFRYINQKERQIIQVPMNDLNVKLSDRDIVKVYNADDFLAKRKIQIIGEVKSPGDYQFFSEMTLNDAIILAKPLEYASKIDIEVARFDGVKSNIFYINYNQSKTFKLKAGDKISVKLDNLRDQTCEIELKGEFVFPGIYRVNKGTRLADVIKKAGGFTDSAFLNGAIFSRKKVAEYDDVGHKKVIEDEKRRFIYDQTHLGNLSIDSQVSLGIMMTARKEALEYLEMKTQGQSGRIVLDLYKSDFESSNDNFTIHNGDILEIPVQPESVHLVGGVQQNISISYNENYSLNDYVINVGGYTKYADSGNVVIFKSSGRVLRSGEIEPGDIIYVPEKVIISFNWLQFLTNITQIVSNAVTSIALIRSIQ